jgi:organic radical activating enzyme
MIKYKGIIHERVEDAPFVGALIIADRCSRNCKNCFNESLKSKTSIENTAYEIIKEVKSNPFNNGIILSGLEWTEQKDDLIELVSLAKRSRLQVMIHTGLTEESFFRILDRNIFENCYIKFGEYEEHLSSNIHESMGVRLASSNQYIVYIHNAA